MIRTVPKPKNCKYKPCGKEFINFNSAKREYCSYGCEAKDTQEKEVNEKVKGFKENLKNQSYFVQLLQVVFNTFIRKRDKGKPCISCNGSLGEKYHAGHYFSTGAYPNLRFNEDNVHGQCIRCNVHLHGNLIGYTQNLPLRIGLEKYNELNKIKNTESKPSIPELKALIEKYKILIK